MKKGQAREFYHLAFILKALKIQDKGMFANKSGKLGPFYHWTRKERDEWSAEIADRLNCYYGCSVLRLKREFVPQDWNAKGIHAFSPTDALGIAKPWLPGNAFVSECTFDVNIDDADVA